MEIDGTERSLAHLVRRSACDSNVMIIGRSVTHYLLLRNLYALISSIKNVKAM